MRAWTLGHAPTYEIAIRRPGSAKAPSGIVFQTKEEAEQWRQRHGRLSWLPYEIELPADWGSVVTRDRHAIAEAFHAWHQIDESAARGPSYRAAVTHGSCEVCHPCSCPDQLEYDALLVEARFINPDTGEPS